MFAGTGVVQGSYALSDSMVNAVCLMDNTHLRFNAFLNNVKVPLDKLSVDFEKSVTDLKGAAVQDPQLSQNVRDIGTAFDNIKAIALDRKANVPSGSISETCKDVWQSIIDEATTAAANTNEEADGIDQSLIDVQVSIQTSVVDASADATIALADGSKTIGDTQKQIDELLNPRKYSLVMYAEQVSGQKDSSAFGMYGWSFCVVVIAIMGIVGMRISREEVVTEEAPKGANTDMWGDVIRLKMCPGQCFACCSFMSWWLTLFFGTLCAFFAVIFLPIHAVGSDACLVIPTLPQNLATISGSPQIGQIMDTCWNQTGNLFDGLGLRSSINVDGIDFAELNKNFGGDGVSIDKSGVTALKKAVEDIQQACYVDYTSEKAFTLAAVDFISFNITHAENAFNTNPAASKLTTSGEALIDVVKCAVGDFVKGTGCCK